MVATTDPTTKYGPLTVRVLKARYEGARGYGVLWGRSKGIRQYLYFGTRTRADRFAERLRAGEDAFALVRQLWAAGPAMTPSEMGKKGSASYHASVDPAVRSAIAKAAIKTRWDRYRAAKAAEAGAAPEAPAPRRRRKGGA